MRTFISNLKLSLLTVLMGMALLTSSCDARGPIRIGFAGELTGRNADLGIQGRNGSQFAVDLLNQQGGINGRQVELIIQDDHGTPEGAVEADQALIDAGVVAIIGHMTSSQTIAAIPTIEHAEIVLFSPTASTPSLAGLDDHFFRVNPTNSSEASKTAEHIINDISIANAAIIIDTDNLAYTETYQDAFTARFTGLGGEITHTTQFSSSENPDFGQTIEGLLAVNPDCVLMISSAVDSALITQQIRLAGSEAQLFISGWGLSYAFLQNGGQSVEETLSIVNYDPNNQTEAFQDFQARYSENFGNEATFAAAQAYEAVFFLAEALGQTSGGPTGLREAILNIKNFNVIGGTITLDEYGDAVRAKYLVQVHNGKFVTLKTIPLTDP